MTDIIYYTDNTLPAEMNALVRRKLIEAAEGKRIISVSQKPISFGENYCVGEIGRSYLSIYKQILAGAQRSDAQFIALAEHDNLYTPEHFKWTPIRDDVFFYNVNNWLVGWKTGHYTKTVYRLPLSMLICGRESAIDALKDRIYLLEHGFAIRKASHYCGEIGIQPLNIALKKQLPREQRKGHDYLRDLGRLCKETGMRFRDWMFSPFQTGTPQLDIRHETNFSGRKSYACDATELPYWGKWEDVRNGA